MAVPALASGDGLAGPPSTAALEGATALEGQADSDRQTDRETMAMGYPRYPEPPRALTKRARRAEARGEARGRKAEERRRRAEAKAEAREAKARANRAKVKAKGQRQLMAQLSTKAKRHQVKV